MASQFGAPSGARGWLAARLVARLTGEANRWMVDRLEVGPDDRLVDVGCGPGLAVSYAADRCGAAKVAGVDASEVMVGLARRRNRRAIREGRVEIHRADAATLPLADASFTAAGSLNSLQFWASPEKGLGELHRVLEPGGRVAVVLMARSDDPAGPTPPPWVTETLDRMREAGFADLGTAGHTFGGVLHHALLGRRPAKTTAPHSTPRRTG